MNEQERPEDTVRRFAQQIGELEQWKAKYREAAELWDALEIKNNQQVDKALIIAKLVDFSRPGPPLISSATTDGCDWVDEWGLISSWKAISYSQKEYDTEDHDD